MALWGDGGKYEGRDCDMRLLRSTRVEVVFEREVMVSRKDIIITLLDQLEEMATFMAVNLSHSNEARELVHEARAYVETYRKEYKREEESAG